MITTEIYLDALGRLGISFAISVLFGAVILDRFKFSLFGGLMLMFLVLTQWQSLAVMHDLGLTNLQILTPTVVTILFGILFVVGSGIGYKIKMKFKLAYADQSPDVVAKEIIEEVNGNNQISNSSIKLTKEV